MEYKYQTHGTCSRTILFELDEAKVLHNVRFIGGCNGNLKSIGKLVEGRPAEEVMNLLSGVTCGSNPTSCGDQFAHALAEALHQAL